MCNSQRVSVRPFNRNCKLPLVIDFPTAQTSVHFCSAATLTPSPMCGVGAGEEDSANITDYFLFN